MHLYQMLLMPRKMLLFWGKCNQNLQQLEQVMLLWHWIIKCQHKRIKQCSFWLLYTLSSNTYTNNNGHGSFFLRDFATTTDPSGVYGGNTGVGSQTLLSFLILAVEIHQSGIRFLSGLTYGTNNLGIGSNVILPGGVGTAVVHVNNQLSIQNVIYGINMNSSGNNVSVATHPTAISVLS